MMRFVPVWFLFFLALFAAAYFLLFVRVECRSVEAVDIDFGRPYAAVLMRLGRKESMERMLAANGGVLLEKHWESFDMRLEEPPFISTWSLSAKGTFRIRNSSGHLAEDAEVSQSVSAKKGFLSIESDLSCLGNHIKKHETKISVQGNRNSHGKVENEVVYERVVPFWMETYLKGRVDEYNRNYVARLGSCVESIAKD
jgi:hypothetical protein